MNTDRNAVNYNPFYICLPIRIFHYKLFPLLTFQGAVLNSLSHQGPN